MRTFKSLTGRTRVSVNVAERGDVEVRVFRNNQCVEAFNLPGEDGLNNQTVFKKLDDGSIEIWQPGAHGLMKLESTIAGGVEVESEEVTA